MKLFIALGILVDVRTPQEFGAGHFPEVVNFPVDDLHSRLGEKRTIKRSLSTANWANVAT